MRVDSCIGGCTVRISRVHSSFPRPSCGTAANVDQGVARSEEIHPQAGAHRTGRLHWQNFRRGQRCLLEEILYPFVGGEAFGPAYFSRNPIHVAKKEVMLFAMSRVTLYRNLESSENLRWPLVLPVLHAYKKMLDLWSVCCSFGQQIFNIFVMRTGSHTVPAITVSNQRTSARRWNGNE